ncbi:hypothetical protein [Orenia marismortui]|uniref:Lipoprotein n=1 Tax=Orenia marismortui TaxID=46469 RepID=A0A4R8H1K3_9FIRM|nr:hypothetical protein [Orenia marismortui]TDX52079.1 hypothetical protein C7959_1081 [Orenia marismortui]
MIIKKVKYVLFILISLILILTLLGCSKQIDNSKIKNKVDKINEKITSNYLQSFFPSKEGMVFNFKGTGLEFTSFTRRIVHKEDNFVQIHDNNGGTIVASVYKIKENKIIKVLERPEFYSKSSLIPEARNTDNKEVILKKSLQEGEIWESAGQKREIVEILDNLKVPAGNFYDVIKIKITPLENSQSYEFYEYYAKNIGLIMKENRGEGYKVISKLSSYGLDLN